MRARFRSDGRPALPLTDLQWAARDEVAQHIAEGAYQLIDVPCPLCDVETGVDVTERDMYGLPMGVRVCGGCGLVYTHRRLDDESLTAFYNGPYRRLDRGVPFAEEEFFALEQAKGRRISEWLTAHRWAVPADGLVVEIGCGAGGILQHFRAQGHSVLGTDLGAEYVAYGTRMHGLDLRVADVTGTVELLRQQPGRVALVILEQVIEHLGDPVGHLRQIAGMLDQEGAIFIGTPGLGNIGRHYRADFLRYLQIPHLVHFDRRSLAAVAARAGLIEAAGDDVVMARYARGELRRDLRPNPPGETIRRLRRLERRHRADRAAQRLRAFSARAGWHVGAAARGALERTRSRL